MSTMNRAQNRGLKKTWGSNAFEKGMPSTTVYTTTAQSRGFPSSMSGGQGLTMSKINPAPTNTGGSSGSSYGSRSRGKSTNNDAYNALLAAYKNSQYDDYYNKKKGAAQAAYDKGMGMLNDAYGAYMAALAENLDSTKGQLLDAYNRSKKNIQDDAAESLKQAYINKMQSARNIDQEMSAQGLSGGASESTRASMANNYGNARNEINTTQNRNLSTLEGDYNDNLASALQAYNQAVASAQLQKAQQAIELEQALANNEIAALDDYYSLMGDTTDNFNGSLDQLLVNMNGLEFDPTRVTNAYNAPEVIQANTQADRTNNNILKALQEIMAQGNGNKNISSLLNNSYLMQLLSQTR